MNKSALLNDNSRIEIRNYSVESIEKERVRTCSPQSPCGSPARTAISPQKVVLSPQKVSYPKNFYFSPPRTAFPKTYYHESSVKLIHSPASTIKKYIKKY